MCIYHLPSCFVYLPQIKKDMGFIINFMTNMQKNKRNLIFTFQITVHIAHPLVTKALIQSSFSQGEIKNANKLLISLNKDDKEFVENCYIF